MGEGCIRSTSWSELGPILFNIFLSHLFLIIDETEFASFMMQETLLKLLSCHYRSLPKIFLNRFQIMNARQFWKMSFDLKHRWNCRNAIGGIFDTTEKLFGIEIDSKFYI